MKNKSTKKKPRGIKEMIVKTNNKALARTEDMVTTSLEIAAQWQTVADKALKGGLKLAAKQQDLVFDVLNEFKNDLKIGKKKFNKLVA